MPEFARATLKALRQPVESGRVSVACGNAHAVYPARVQLVAAMNPCRCGYLDDAVLACSRSPSRPCGYRDLKAGSETTVRTNADTDGALLEEVAAPDSGRPQAPDRGGRAHMRLSARGYRRVLRVARTLADLESADRDAATGVKRIHIAEALSYRRIAPGR